MKIYKIYIGVLLGVISVTTGCTTSYPVETYDLSVDKVNPIQNTEYSNLEREPLAVLINGQDYYEFTPTFSSRATTRGVGLVDHSVDIDSQYFNKLTHATFYLYSFRATSTDYSCYRFAKNTSGAKKDTVNCLIDGADYGSGLPVYVDSATNFLNLKGEDVVKESGYYLSCNDVISKIEKINNSWYFYGNSGTSEGKKGYKFFCYFVDDCELKSPKREKERIYYDNFEVDGTQDVRCGTAPRISEAMFKSNISSTDKNLIMNDGYYSAYAASRGVFPHIPMAQELSSLQFYAVPGRESAAGIVIDSVFVYARQKGVFTVASVDTKKYPLGIQWSDEIKRYSLFEASEDGIRKCQPLKPDTLTWKEDTVKTDVDWYDRENLNRQSIGGSLMIAPDYALYNEYVGYTLEIQYKYKGVDGNYVSATIKRELSSPDGFKKGHKYDISIGIFGPEDIRTFVDILDWEEGGDIPVNPDEI